MKPPRTKEEDLAEEFFGKAGEAELETTPHSLNEIVSEAALLGELGIHVDPDVADDIGAEMMALEDIEKHQP